VLVRKTVTVLFSDVVTSSAYGERFDPESWRRVMSRYFEEMKAVIERHGGTVEKFIGDAVMAVFGVPVIHEDDALRAVRAAAEMRDRLTELNDELEETWGVRLEMRIGVNTGEVVAGDPATGSTFVTGDAVNLGKRLEQAARPGEILIGKATYPLVKDAVSAGPLESFTVKGKSDPVAPLRLHEVEADAPGLARRLDAPLVGRVSELAVLESAFERVEQEGSCRLVTVLGPAGIGKSRLATELVARVGDRARALHGRCLPYGERITFFPVVQLLREAGGVAGLAEVLDGVQDGDVVAERVGAVLGVAPASGGSEETFWAIRRFLEELARNRPLLVTLEDIHWAEPTLLDLVEYLAGWTRGAPILLVCLARRDLLELQPSWLAPRENASLLVLEPLSDADAGTLVNGLGLDAAIGERAVEQITAAAEGNPLFLEQLAALAAEEGGVDGDVHVPPSIQALLAERLDRLDTGERAVVERAAVIGKEFVRGAVVDLCPPELRPTVGRELMSLVRKELIRPDTGITTTDDGFRFRHVLIRDAAYDGLPKEVRAELHERFSRWLEGNADERLPEVEELVAYHLERAFRCRAELGRHDPATHALAQGAAERLAVAGRRALARGDVPAAVNLLERATGLLDAIQSPDPQALIDLGAALREQGDPLGADAVLAQAAEAAEDEGTRLRVEIERAVVRMYVDPTVEARQVLELAAQATPVFEESRDDLGLSRAWSLVGEAHWMRCRLADTEDVLGLALGYAERVDDRRQVAWALGTMCRAAVFGPRPVPDALRRCLEIRKRARGEPTLLAVIEAMLAVLEAMRGHVDDAREHYARSRAELEELGLNVQIASLRMYAGLAELIAGNAAAAERELRPPCEALERMGERSFLSTMAALLARAVEAQGRYGEAEELTTISRDAASADDQVTQVLWRGTQAKVLARRGEAQPAEALATEAVRLSRETDFVTLRADALVDLAESLALVDRRDDAAERLDEAIALYQAKGNTASRERTAALRDELFAARSA
jgi:class 3 adenylate cyclase/tetratricopeptide (TPR) repeat protein